MNFFSSSPPRDSSSSSSAVGGDPPDLHGHWLDGVRDPVVSPGVPDDAGPQAPLELQVFRRAVEVGQSTLVEPPASLVVLAAAALHCPVGHGAGGVAAVVVHVWGAERSRVLVLLLLVAAEGVACTEDTEVRRQEELLLVHSGNQAAERHGYQYWCRISTSF